MQLKELSISRLRNLSSIDLELGSHFNFFLGKNGSGKTSLLEAIHLLATGRSFRARLARQVIAFGAESCVVSALAVQKQKEGPEIPIKIGVEKTISGQIKMRLGEQDCHSVASLAQTTPFQLINSDLYDILEAAPNFRRSFLDWSMFHVEHSFFSVWQRYKRALLQRNAALRENKKHSNAIIRAWDNELIETGEIINAQRSAVLLELVPLFLEVSSGFLGEEYAAKVGYISGWGEDLSLEQALDRSFERDKVIGFTNVGPHRADLSFIVGKNPAKTLLSRGQSKLFICALLIARAKLLYIRQGRRCLFLIDDLCSELDSGASRLLIQELSRLESQVLVTSIEGNNLISAVDSRLRAQFMIEGGKIEITAARP